MRKESLVFSTGLIFRFNGIFDLNLNFKKRKNYWAVGMCATPSVTKVCAHIHQFVVSCDCG